jgi:AGZA family xanthine/uracil permease-like MFS transporter
VVTGLLFAVALFLSPLAGVVPSQAAAPALVAVGFLLMAQVRNIDWTQYDVAIPAFLTIAVMPFTYSITNGIGAGFLSYVAIKLALGKWRDIHPLVWGVSVAFLAYFAIDPIQQAAGVK